ncbi:MAG: 4'-phosphopantetheinyl transferase superfamily protein [Pelobium sp.]
MPKIQLIEVTWESFNLDEGLNDLPKNDIWRIKIPQSEINIDKKYFHLISEEEMEKSSRFVHLKHQNSYLLSRLVLKILLAKYLNCQPETIYILKGTNGKPYIKEDIYFNISHSGDWILLAFSTHEIGIDIEYINPDQMTEELLNHVFHPKELKMIKESKKPIEEFYRFWTRKEAFLKKTGKGINANLNAINTVENLDLYTFNVDKNHLATVSCEDLNIIFRSIIF